MTETPSIYNFPRSSEPIGRLEQNKKGNLYGTTSTGGMHGYGSVFELVKDGGTWKEQDLYSFSGNDGAYPYEGVIAVNGPLWGTTEQGGSIG